MRLPTLVVAVTVSDISWYRGTDVESWITSDGRAYFVQLTESAYSDVNMSNPDVNGEDSLPVRSLPPFTPFALIKTNINREMIIGHPPPPTPFPNLY